MFRLPLIGTAVGLAAGLLGGCSKPSPEQVKAREVADAHRKVDPASCAACHQKEFDSWKGSHHALAQVDGKIGVAPLWQRLVKTTDGRVQVSNVAFDPAKKEDFDVFGGEKREPGEWGHWTGRGMNWNSQCAFCHNTGVDKAYDVKTDTYHTVVGHEGVTCAACHRTDGQTMTMQQIEDACASCHSRRSELDGGFKPGAAYADHFQLLIPDDTEAYYPDGQVKEEDFEYAAFRGSKMHAAGVSCVNCHDPHSGQLAAQGNPLCMTCHGGGNKLAPVIQPEVHSHHPLGSTGDSCIECHMPTTVYMQRHPRRDHGFTIPDPLLTVKLGEPNACNRCHTDKNPAWAEEAVEKWYGPKMDRPTRERALAVAAARAGDQSGAEATLLKVLKGTPANDQNGYWRAVAAGLLAPWSTQPDVQAPLTQALKDPDSLVRGFAARALGTAIDQGSEPAKQAVTAALNDERKMVRIEAAWDVKDSVDENSPAGKDLLQSLAFNADQPTGEYRLGMYDVARHKGGKAIASFKKAVEWDPLSPPFRSGLATALSIQGKNAETLAALKDAVARIPQSAELRYELGLSLAEAGDTEGARAALEAAVKLDPRMAPAWYNLGLARSQAGDVDGAENALARAEELDPSSGRAAYALATVFARAGDGARARQHAEEALRREPQMNEAQGLLEQIGSGGGAPQP